MLSLPCKRVIQVIPNMLICCFREIGIHWISVTFATWSWCLDPLRVWKVENPISRILFSLCRFRSWPLCTRCVGRRSAARCFLYFITGGVCVRARKHCKLWRRYSHFDLLSNVFSCFRRRRMNRVAIVLVKKTRILITSLLVFQEIVGTIHWTVPKFKLVERNFVDTVTFAFGRIGNEETLRP